MGHAHGATKNKIGNPLDELNRSTEILETTIRLFVLAPSNDPFQHSQVMKLNARSLPGPGQTALDFDKNLKPFKLPAARMGS